MPSQPYCLWVIKSAVCLAMRVTKKVFDMCLRGFQRRTSYARSWMELLLKSFWVHGKNKRKGFLTKPRLVSRSIHMWEPASLWMDCSCMFTSGLWKESCTPPQQQTIQCVMVTTQRQKKTQSWLPQKSSSLWLFMKKDNVLPIQCNDNIMYYNTVEECMSIITAYWPFLDI